MRKPEMLLFDYGNTLVYEPAFDREAGFRAVLAYATANPRGVRPPELAEAYAPALDKLMSASRAAGADIMDMCFKRLIYEELGLCFSLDQAALELVFWDAAGPGRPMPGIGGFLAELAKRGIRSAVLSNMNFREENLKARIRRLLPDNRFEFILCSCEYGTRKPAPEFFRLALCKAGLGAEEVWYVGDNPRADIWGAHQAGLYPVYYDCPDLPCPYRSPADAAMPDCPHLRITEWGELLEALDGMDSDRARPAVSG